MVAQENETKKLLEFKASLEARLREIEVEMADIRKALEQINDIIVNTGFRTLAPSQVPKATTPPKPAPVEEPVEPQHEPEADPELVGGDEEMSITGKDGTVLGALNVEGNSLVFTPSDVFQFTTDIPPFQSFLVERVLDNMRRTDQERASNGELEPQDILEYTVDTDGERITSLTITNYGGERRLRELNSSLRWTLDKMYDKLREG